VKKLLKEDLLDLLKSMLRIRAFEEKIDFLFSRALIHGTAHFCIGQEAVAVGACSVLNDNDLVTSTHRCHGHALAKGLDMKRFLAELMGKETGYCKGKGGTQHNACIEKGFLTNGITAGNTSIAAGAALAFKYKKTDQVVVCFLGDGAVNEGVFNESVNMASLWKLPIIYICENNLYAMSTPINISHSNTSITNRIQSYKIPTTKINGMDVLAVKEEVGKAVERARSNKGPSFIECETYRFCGHSKNDQREYRTKEEESSWSKKDPILMLKEKLINENMLNKTEFSAIQEEVKKEVEEAVDFAKNSPEISNDKLLKDIYA
jgi:pyruvate dehydrogenase E1 component alpha subunit